MWTFIQPFEDLKRGRKAPWEGQDSMVFALINSHSNDDEGLTQSKF